MSISVVLKLLIIVLAVVVAASLSVALVELLHLPRDLKFEITPVEYTVRGNVTLVRYLVRLEYRGDVPLSNFKLNAEIGGRYIELINVPLLTKGTVVSRYITIEITRGMGFRPSRLRITMSILELINVVAEVKLSA